MAGDALDVPVLMAVSGPDEGGMGSESTFLRLSEYWTSWSTSQLLADARRTEEKSPSPLLTSRRAKTKISHRPLPRRLCGSCGGAGAMSGRVAFRQAGPAL